MIGAKTVSRSPRPGRPVELEPLLAAAQVIGLEQPGQAEHVIGVVVAEEHDVEIDEPDLRAQQLPLRALAAVEQDAIAAAPDQRRRGRATRRRRRARGAQEDDVQSTRPSLRGAQRDQPATRRTARPSVTSPPPVDARAAARGGARSPAGSGARSTIEQRAADEAGDVAVVEARALLDRIGEVERDEPARPGRAPPSPPPGSTRSALMAAPAAGRARSARCRDGSRGRSPRRATARRRRRQAPAIDHRVSPGSTTCTRGGMRARRRPRAARAGRAR